MIAGAHGHPEVSVFKKIRVGTAWRCARLSPLLLRTHRVGYVGHSAFVQEFLEANTESPHLDEYGTFGFLQHLVQL